MRDAEKLFAEGKDGGRLLLAFEQATKAEIEGLRKKAIAAQERFYCFKHQIEDFGRAEAVGGNPTVPTRLSSHRRRPRWDQETRTLYLGDEIIKRYNRGAASNQIDIIEAFANKKWLKAVDDPFKNPKKLNQTVYDLNRTLPANTIRFRQDGTGETVCWEYAT
jgi:hypothetical protein